MYRKDHSRPSLVKPRPACHRTARSVSGPERAQALVVIALVFFALLAFVGLLVDVGAVYVTYTVLKTAVDSAAVAAANNIKTPITTSVTRKELVIESAREVLRLNHVSDLVDVKVYLCADRPAIPASFDKLCPAPSKPQRKLAYIEAQDEAPLFFLSLFGVKNVTLRVSSVGEAAGLDLVLVYDLSSSMGAKLEDAKEAGKKMLEKLYPTYDQVGVVTFDVQARVTQPITTNLDLVMASIDDMVLRTDPSTSNLVWWTAKSQQTCNGVSRWEPYNPVYPDDRDGDGRDADPGKDLCSDTWDYSDPANPVFRPDLWDDDSQYPPQVNLACPDQIMYYWEPCDNPDIRDAIDWNGDGDHENDKPDGPDSYVDNAFVSTCTGCGIRVATDELSRAGRTNGVWVMILLTDGTVNMSDTGDSAPDQIKNVFSFCGNEFWKDFCFDIKNDGRYCIDAKAEECPPGATHTSTSGPYSVLDYAMDMVDYAALQYVTNPHEPRGQNIVIYSIGLGASALSGEGMLRYAANVGDDGDRTTDPCLGAPAGQSCGKNYYFAPDETYLVQIYERIADRIYTKISR